MKNLEVVSYQLGNKWIGEAVSFDIKNNTGNLNPPYEEIVKAQSEFIRNSFNNNINNDLIEMIIGLVDIDESTEDSEVIQFICELLKDEPLYNYKLI